MAKLTAQFAGMTAGTAPCPAAATETDSGRVRIAAAVHGFKLARAEGGRG